MSLDPTPGVHRNIPDLEYRLWSGASQSQLSILKKSPAHLKASIDQPSEQTGAMALGSAVHCAILEPEKFKTRYGIVPDDVDRRSAAGKQRYGDLVAQFGDRLIGESEYHEIIVPMREAVVAHSVGGLMLREAEFVEGSVFWRDETTGIGRKARIDGYSLELRTIFDLKTTADASRDEFASSIYRLGYHRQGAFYTEALRRFGQNVEHFVIVCVEKKPPFAVATYRLTNEALLAGEVEVRRLLKVYDKCVQTDQWPGYSEKLVDIGIPQWALNAINEETAHESA